MPYSLLKVNHFGATCCLYAQGQRKSQARNQHEAGTKQRLCYNPEDERIMFFQSAG
jgi:hypothetical protein